MSFNVISLDFRSRKLAAFMSTVDTHLNWGASYLVNDIYQRFLKKDASQTHYVRAARLASVLLAVAAVATALNITSIKGAWSVLYSLGAGMGPILVLRWFWWRVNAWTELSAMITSVIAGVTLTVVQWPYHIRLVVVAAVSLAVSLTVTLLTAAEPTERLAKFYRRVRPGGWWAPVKKSTGETDPGLLTPAVLVDILLGLVMVYGSMLGIGHLIFKNWWWAALLLVPAALSSVVLFLRYKSR